MCRKDADSKKNSNYLCMLPIEEALFSIFAIFIQFFSAKILNGWEIPLQVSWGIRRRRGPSHIYLFYGEASSKKRRRRGRKRRYIVRKGVRGGFAKPFSRMVYARPGNWKKDFENRMGRRRSKNSFGFLDPFVGVPRNGDTWFTLILLVICAIRRSPQIRCLARELFLTFFILRLSFKDKNGNYWLCFSRLPLSSLGFSAFFSCFLAEFFLSALSAYSPQERKEKQYARMLFPTLALKQRGE